MTPKQSGIYVARPVRIDLVPVTRDARYVDTCAKVNCANVKIGKAKNLAAREKNYRKDFDEENILFVPLLITHEITRAETAILTHLRTYRLRSPKGGLMDWLEGISVEDAIAAVFDTLDKEHITYRRIWSGQTDVRPNMR